MAHVMFVLPQKTSQEIDAPVSCSIIHHVAKTSPVAKTTRGSGGTKKSLAVPKYPVEDKEVPESSWKSQITSCPRVKIVRSVAANRRINNSF